MPKYTGKQQEFIPAVSLKKHRMDEANGSFIHGYRRERSLFSEPA